MKRPVWLWVLDPRVEAQVGLLLVVAAAAADGLVVVLSSNLARRTLYPIVKPL
jgi:hypothetical protein